MFKGLLVAFLALTAGVSPADAQSAPYITGVAVTGGGAVPMRKNINDLQSAGGPQWLVTSLTAMSGPITHHL